jgi:hypothetical protein
MGYTGNLSQPHFQEELKGCCLKPLDAKVSPFAVSSIKMFGDWSSSLDAIIKNEPIIDTR